MGGARWLVDLIQVDCGSGFIGIRLVTYGGNAWGWVGEGRACGGLRAGMNRISTSRLCLPRFRASW
jgi:hypothetical protein